MRTNTSETGFARVMHWLKSKDEEGPVTNVPDDVVEMWVAGASRVQAVKVRDVRLVAHKITRSKSCSVLRSDVEETTMHWKRLLHILVGGGYLVKKRQEGRHHRLEYSPAMPVEREIEGFGEFLGAWHEQLEVVLRVGQGGAPSHAMHGAQKLHAAASVIGKKEFLIAVENVPRYKSAKKNSMDLMAKLADVGVIRYSVVKDGAINVVLTLVPESRRITNWPQPVEELGATVAEEHEVIEELGDPLDEPSPDELLKEVTQQTDPEPAEKKTGPGAKKQDPVDGKGPMPAALQEIIRDVRATEGLVAIEEARLIALKNMQAILEDIWAS